jgi:S-adenosylmethionine synthetase
MITGAESNCAAGRTLYTPVSFLVETFGTESESRRDFAAELSREFDLRPQGIIEALDLLRPIYYQTAAYGHFGRTDVALPWEATVPESARAHV